MSEGMNNQARLKLLQLRKKGLEKELRSLPRFSPMYRVLQAELKQTIESITERENLLR